MDYMKNKLSSGLLQPEINRRNDMA